MASMTVAEKIAEEIFRLIEREKRIIKGDLVEAAERILKMEAPPPIVCDKFDVSKFEITKPGNAVQIHTVPFVYVSDNTTGKFINWTGGTGGI